MERSVRRVNERHCRSGERLTVRGWVIALDMILRVGQRVDLVVLAPARSRNESPRLNIRQRSRRHHRRADYRPRRHSQQVQSVHVMRGSSASLDLTQQRSKQKFGSMPTEPALMPLLTDAACQPAAAPAPPSACAAGPTKVRRGSGLSVWEGASPLLRARRRTAGWRVPARQRTLRGR
jgi:hypothetical protein